MNSTMSAANPNAYFRTKVLTATPGELRMMLLDGAVKFARQGQEGLTNRDFEAAYNGISRCQAILMELINALDPPHDPELCSRLSSLYTYLYMKLVHASTQRDPAAIDEVLKLLEYERETWRLALERLSGENVSAAAMRGTPDAAPPFPRHDGPGGADMIGGSVSVRG